VAARTEHMRFTCSITIIMRKTAPDALLPKKYYQPTSRRMLYIPPAGRLVNSQIKF
jgi:hypothetical protein